MKQVDKTKWRLTLKAFVIEAAMSFQVTILKVLAGHPGGQLSVDDLKNAVALLIGSGPDFTARMNRLAARVPDLDIFSQALVVRDAQGWHITEAGRILLAELEQSATMPPAGAAAEEEGSTTYAPALPFARPRGVRRRRKVSLPRRPAA